MSSAKVILVGLVLIAFFALAAMILSGCQPTKEYSQSNVNLLNAMVYAKKDGQCFGIIVSSTYGAHDVVSVTLVPMELCK